MCEIMLCSGKINRKNGKKDKKEEKCNVTDFIYNQKNRVEKIIRYGERKREASDNPSHFYDQRVCLTLITVLRK